MKKLCLKYGIVVCPKSEPTKQMVLGTDNQEKEAPYEGSRVDWCSFLVSKHVPIYESTPSTKANSSMFLSRNWRTTWTNLGP